MTKRIIYQRVDGGLSIVIPDIRSVVSNETEDSFLSRVANKSVPNGTPYSIVDESIIPVDRTFRNAWFSSGNSVLVYMPKARDIQMEKIRALRDPKLAELDVEAIKALEAKDEVKLAEITALKQKLRDIPQDFDLTQFSTPEELKAAIPDELK